MLYVQNKPNTPYTPTRPTPIIAPVTTTPVTTTPLRPTNINVTNDVYTTPPITTSPPRPTTPVITTPQKTQKTFTIINFDKNLSLDQLQASLDASITSKNVKYTIKNATQDDWNLLKPVTGNDGKPFLMPTQSNMVMIMGKDNTNFTKLNTYPGYSVNNSAVVSDVDILGGNYGKNTNKQLGMRILHEIDHSVGLEADNMYTTQKTGFDAWLQANNKTNYLDLYSNTNKQNVATDVGLEAQNDFHNWLADSNSNVWYFRKQRSNNPAKRYTTKKPRKQATVRKASPTRSSTVDTMVFGNRKQPRNHVQKTPLHIAITPKMPAMKRVQPIMGIQPYTVNPKTRAKKSPVKKSKNIQRLFY
jgi:hypothetical protein